MKVGIGKVLDLPHFLVRGGVQGVNKLLGAVFIENKSLWGVPAYPPYTTLSLEDLETLGGGEIILTPKAQAYLSGLGTAVQGYVPLTKFYSHQKEGFNRAVLNVNYGIFYGRGLGKTKIALDVVRHLLQQKEIARVLVLVMKVNTNTWVKEADVHANDIIQPTILQAGGAANKKSKGTYAAHLKVMQDTYDAWETMSLRRYGEALTEKRRAARHKKIFKGKKSQAHFTAQYKLQQIVSSSSNMLIVPYDSAKAYLGLLLEEYEYDVIILDESHYIRGGKSTRAKAAIQLGAKATRRYIMTGTPSLGDPRHYWSQLKTLHKDLVPSFWDFQTQHVVKAPWDDRIITGFKNIASLNAKVNLVSHSLEAEECLDLPDRVIQTIELDVPAKIRRHYNDIVDTGSTEVAGENVDVPERVSQIGKLAQIASGFIYIDRRDPLLCDSCEHVESCVARGIKPYTSKCKVVTKAPPVLTERLVAKNPIIDAIVDEIEVNALLGKKVIIWAHHREMLAWLGDAIEARLAKLNPKFKLIRYTADAPDRDTAQERFNDDPDSRVILGQITMGIGVTFKAPVMIYAEVKFTLDSWLQSLDRNWGIRAKGFKKLVVQVYCLKGSIYSFALELLKNKQDLAMMMQRNPECMTCPQAVECTQSSIKPFDVECIYDSKVQKSKIPFKGL
jgi:hypothetical protein